MNLKLEYNYVFNKYHYKKTSYHSILFHLFGALNFWRAQSIISISYLHFSHTTIHIYYLTWSLIQTEWAPLPLDD